MHSIIARDPLKGIRSCSLFAPLRVSLTPRLSVLNSAKALQTEHSAVGTGEGKGLPDPETIQLDWSTARRVSLEVEASWADFGHLHFHLTIIFTVRNNRNNNNNNNKILAEAI